MTTDTFSGEDTHAAFNTARNEYGFSDVRYVVEYQEGETVTTAMDLTDKPGSAPVVVDLRGDVAYTAGDPIAFDINNSHNNLYIDTGGFLMAGNGSQSVPDACFFISRGSDSNNCAINSLMGWGMVVGDWKSAPLYNLGGEVWKFGIRLYNTFSSGTAAAMNLVNNVDGLSSVHGTAQGGVSTASLYLKCDFRGGPSDHALYFEPTRNLKFIDPYFTAGSEDFIHIDASNENGGGPHIF